MQTNTLRTNQTVSGTVAGALHETLVNYLWKLVEDRDDNHSPHYFAISPGELFGMGILEVLHSQNGDARNHKVFGIPPAECCVRVACRGGEYRMEMEWESCAA